MQTWTKSQARNHCKPLLESRVLRNSVIMAGVTGPVAPSGGLNPGIVSVSGQRETANGFYVNGGDVQERMNGGTGVNSGGSFDDYGGTGMFSGGQGKTFGESAYNGTISWIRDLTKVPSVANAAGIGRPSSGTGAAP